MARASRSPTCDCGGPYVHSSSQRSSIRNAACSTHELCSLCNRDREASGYLFDERQRVSSSALKLYANSIFSKVWSLEPHVVTSNNRSNN